MTGSKTQLLQLSARSAGDITERVKPKAGANRGEGASCAFPDVMLSTYDQGIKSVTVKKNDRILLVSPENKKALTTKKDSNTQDRPIIDDIGMKNQKVNRSIPTPINRVDDIQAVKPNKIQTTRIEGHLIQTGMKSTVDAKHPVFNMPLIEHAWWKINNAKRVTSKSAHVINRPPIHGRINEILGGNNVRQLHKPGMRLTTPMTSFEVKIWGEANELMSTSEVALNDSNESSKMLLSARDNAVPNRVAQYAYRSTTHSNIVPKMKNSVSRSSNSSPAQKPVMSEKGAESIPSNSTTEQAPSDTKELGNTTTSTGISKVAEEAVGLNNVRSISPKVSSVINKDKRSTGKTKSSILSQQNDNKKTNGGGSPEVSGKRKQAAKQQALNQEISEMVKAAEKGAKPRVGLQVDGVASPISGIISTSNGQAAPVNAVPAQPHSRWDSLMRFVQRIMQNARIQQRHEGVSELRVRMASETLGKLMVHVSVTNNHVDVRFALDTPQARQMMHSYKAELAQILKDSGASTVNIDVSTSSADGEERFQQFSEADDRYGHRTFNSQVLIDSNRDYPDGFNREDELTSPVNTVNSPFEHSSMVWVA